jgi:hypothetical protein
MRLPLPWQIEQSRSRPSGPPTRRTGSPWRRAPFCCTTSLIRSPTSTMQSAQQWPSPPLLVEAVPLPANIYRELRLCLLATHQLTDIQVINWSMWQSFAHGRSGGSLCAAVLSHPGNLPSGPNCQTSQSRQPCIWSSITAFWLRIS